MICTNRGTSHAATTDASGNFTISNVVPGTHDLTYSLPEKNYRDGSVWSQSWRANSRGEGSECVIAGRKRKTASSVSETAGS